MEETSKTLIHYYQGAYGSTIRIDTKEVRWLKCFKRNVLHLARGDIRKTEIACMDNTEISNLKSLTLVKVLSKRPLKITIANEKNSFTWSLNTEELITLAELIDGLLDNNEAGHQYLTGEDDNALIVLSYKE